MADGIGVGLAGDFDLVLGDDRPGDAGAQQIIVFVNRVSAQHREAEFLGEFLAEVLDDHFISSALVCFVLDALEFIALSQLGGEGDQLHAGIAILEPRKDDAGVQSAAVGEDDFLRMIRLLIEAMQALRKGGQYKVCGL